MQTESTQLSTFTLKNLLLSQLGHRDSILRAVDSRYGLVVMLSLVASAAICREYDGSSFVFEAFELLIPFIVSLVLATVLFVVVAICRQFAKCEALRGGSSYKRFLLGYWLTAPIAWLYAVPIESLTDELSAVRFNLGLLTVVSLWRIVLFSRIAAVLYNLPTWIMLCWIGPVCALIANAAMAQNHIRLAGIMGGVRLSQSDQLVIAFQDQARIVLGYAFVVLIVGWIVSLGILVKMRTQEPKPPPWRQFEIGASIWISLAGVFCLLAVGCYLFQPKLYRGVVVRRLVNQARTTEACRYMTNHHRSDFPAQRFINLPRYESWNRRAEIEVRIQQVLDFDPPDWIAQQILVGAIESLQPSVERAGFEKTELESYKNLVTRLQKKGWIGTLSTDEVNAMLKQIDLELAKL